MNTNEKLNVFIENEIIEWEQVDTGLRRKIMAYDDSLMIVKVDFETGGGRTVQAVASYPKEVFWDTTIPIHKTAESLEFVWTPEACFDNLEGYSFAPNYDYSGAIAFANDANRFVVK